jgi:hypothetical protein
MIMAGLIVEGEHIPIYKKKTKSDTMALERLFSLPSNFIIIDEFIPVQSNGEIKWMRSKLLFTIIADCIY